MKRPAGCPLPEAYTLQDVLAWKGHGLQLLPEWKGGLPVSFADSCADLPAGDWQYVLMDHGDTREGKWRYVEPQYPLVFCKNGSDPAKRGGFYAPPDAIIARTGGARCYNQLTLQPSMEWKYWERQEVFFTEMALPDGTIRLELTFDVTLDVIGAGQLAGRCLYTTVELRVVNNQWDDWMLIPALYPRTEVITIPAEVLPQVEDNVAHVHVWYEQQKLRQKCRMPVATARDAYDAELPRLYAEQQARWERGFAAGEHRLQAKKAAAVAA